MMIQQKKINQIGNMINNEIVKITKLVCREEKTRYDNWLQKWEEIDMISLSNADIFKV